MWNQLKGTRHTIRNLFTKNEAEPLPGPIIPEANVKKEEEKKKDDYVDIDMAFDPE
jgi:hypothetical protein